MPVTYHIQAFEGPLDLLLQLVEQEEFAISDISLAAVADQFIGYLHEQSAIPLQELADFLVVAAKLMYLKSKLLLPSFIDPELEEGPDLATQLRRYQTFVEASKDLDQRWRSSVQSFPRALPLRLPSRTQFVPPAKMSVDGLASAMHRVIARLEPIRHLPSATMERVVTIQEKIRNLVSRIRETAKLTFHEYVGPRASRVERVVSFLALLELVKQRFVRVAQGQLFEDIEILADVLLESFV